MFDRPFFRSFFPRGTPSGRVPPASSQTGNVQMTTWELERSDSAPQLRALAPSPEHVDAYHNKGRASSDLTARRRAHDSHWSEASLMNIPGKEDRAVVDQPSSLELRHCPTEYFSCYGSDVPDVTNTLRND
jgi:hypothetical protein